jgi:hypothetical protein
VTPSPQPGLGAYKGTLWDPAAKIALGQVARNSNLKFGVRARPIYTSFAGLGLALVHSALRRAVLAAVVAPEALAAHGSLLGGRDVDAGILGVGRVRGLELAGVLGVDCCNPTTVLSFQYITYFFQKYTVPE